MTRREYLDAEAEWQRSRRKVLYDEVVCLIKRCSVDLLSFEEVRSSLNISQRVDRGRQEIEVARVRGSVGRYEDFTSAFLPRKEHLRDRWINVDIAVMQGKTPPIDVYQIGDDYFVVDGNHRVSAAMQHGQETIEAFVTEFVTQAQIDDIHSVDALLIESEQAAFLEQTGAENKEAAQSMVFTCSGCYQNVTTQVERYRQGESIIKGAPIASEQAFSEWYEEVYAPAIEAIKRNGLVEQFPDRTEADLFVWAQENGIDLEAVVLEEEGAP